MSSSKTRAVIWDMDGVIADTARAHYHSWKIAFKKQGIKFTDDEFHDVFGQRNDLIVRKKMGTDFNQTLIDEISQDKEECFRDEIGKELNPFPGVVELLELIKKNGVINAVGSSAPLENVEAILKGLKIDHLFNAVVFGQEVKEGKPNPEVFLTAAEKVGADPADCIVIEDAIAGVEAARRAGMACIAVTNSHPVESLKEADWVVDSLERVEWEDLEKIFDRPRR